MLLVGWTKNALAAIALVLLGVGGAMVASDPQLLPWWLAVLLGLGCCVLLLAAIAERQYRVVRDALGQLLNKARVLQTTEVKTQEAFDAWVRDYDLWRSTTARYVEKHLSIAHAASFVDLSAGGEFHILGAFNHEHSRMMNVLGRYSLNLKGIVDRYLSTRS